MVVIAFITKPTSVEKVLIFFPSVKLYVFPTKKKSFAFEVDELTIVFTENEEPEPIIREFLSNFKELKSTLLTRKVPPLIFKSVK